MGIIKTGITLAGGYAMVKAAAGAVEKHDENKRRYQQDYPQQNMQRPLSYNGENGQTYGKYIAPDGTEYPVYQPQPQFQGQFQPVQSAQQNHSQRGIGYEPMQAPAGQRDVRQEPRALEGGFQPPTTSTPPPYQYDRKN